MRVGVLVVAAVLLSLGCRSSTVTSAPAAIDIEEVVDGGVVASFDALLDGGIQFGKAPVLEPITAVLRITNLGSGGLSISSAGTLPDGGAFSLVGAIPSQVGDDGADLTVQFVPPQQQSFTGSLTIDSDDPVNPTVVIPLTGSGSTEGKLTVAPNPLVFGDVGQGQTQTETLTLTSSGTAPLYVSSIGFADGSDPSFAFVSSVQGGFQLSNKAGSNTLPLIVSFTPSASTPAVPGGAILIASSDPSSSTTTVALSAGTVLAPIPKITAPATVAVGSLITLDGNASTDPNVPPLLPLTYQWALVQKPLGSSAALSSLTAAQPTLTADLAGIYDVQLDVTNDGGIMDLAPAHASITAKPQDDLYVEMVWDNDPIDMDLHFLEPGGALDGPGDCNAYSPDAGFDCVPSSDHLVGPGPEWISIDTPLAGTYTVDCVEYAAHNATDVSTNVTVRVYLYGVLSSQLTQSMDQLGSVWTAATITWPSGTITPVGSVTP